MYKARETSNGVWLMALATIYKSLHCHGGAGIGIEKEERRFFKNLSLKSLLP
jgi:hypothetical protein